MEDKLKTDNGKRYEDSELYLFWSWLITWRNNYYITEECLEELMVEVNYICKYNKNNVMEVIVSAR